MGKIKNLQMTECYYCGSSEIIHHCNICGKPYCMEHGEEPFEIDDERFSKYLNDFICNDCQGCIQMMED
ncbi:hypothetical protein [uncultured Arcobacter sp.]|uniref:hypothetical protein n=1 Tax=uncultured Arcobacter sp. TaxID=165434 RepID=UPI00261E60C5|nr:hypothetical protein [uncultured Arcobacter sp.]